MTTVWVVLKDGAVVGVFTSVEFANAVAGETGAVTEVLVNRVAPAPAPEAEKPAAKPAAEKPAK